MVENTRAFFQEIAARGYDSSLRGIKGTCCFEIAGHLLVWATRKHSVIEEAMRMQTEVQQMTR